MSIKPSVLSHTHIYTQSDLLTHSPEIALRKCPSWQFALQWPLCRDTSWGQAMQSAWEGPEQVWQEGWHAEREGDKDRWWHTTYAHGKSQHHSSTGLLGRVSAVVTKNNKVFGFESSCILHSVHFFCYDAMQSRDITTLWLTARCQARLSRQYPLFFHSVRPATRYRVCILDIQFVGCSLATL